MGEVPESNRTVPGDSEGNGVLVSEFDVGNSCQNGRVLNHESRTIGILAGPGLSRLIIVRPRNEDALIIGAVFISINSGILPRAVISVKGRIAGERIFSLALNNLDGFDLDILQELRQSIGNLDLGNDLGILAFAQIVRGGESGGIGDGIANGVGFAVDSLIGHRLGRVLVVDLASG